MDSASDKSKRILIADDDIPLTNVLKNALKKDFIVDICHSISDAINLLDDNNYGLLISDLNFGKENGMILARYARKKFTNIEIVIITGYASVETASEAIELSVRSYLTKPINMMKLKTVAEEAFCYYDFNNKTSEITSGLVTNEKDIRQHIESLSLILKFGQKINKCVNVIDSVKTFLSELIKFTHGKSALIGISTLGFKEIFTLKNSKNIYSEESIMNSLSDHWDSKFEASGFTKENFVNREVTVTFVGDDNGDDLECADPLMITPLSIYGQDIGFIAYCDNHQIKQDETKWFFDVLAPIISPAIYRGFLEKKAKKQAQTDGLTGVANRWSMQESITRELQRAVRYGRDISFLLMDIDDFKKVNDTYGHLIGDEILKQLALVTKNLVRGSDLVARYGGEEFVAILPDTTISGAQYIADRLRTALEEDYYAKDGLKVDYTVTIGVSTFNGEEFSNQSLSNDFWEITSQDLISKADKALYKGKNSGKNRVVLETEI